MTDNIHVLNEEWRNVATGQENSTPLQDYVQSVEESYKAQLAEQGEFFQEELSRVQQMIAFDNKGWDKILGGGINNEPGLSLDQVHQLSENIRELVAGGTLLGRARDLRHQYVWSKGVTIPGTDKPEKKKRGRPSAKKSLDEFFHDPINQDSIFAPEAQLKMETAAVTDGTFLALGDNITKQVRAIPISEITAFVTNPDFVDEVWAYQRTWTTHSPDGNSKTNKKWFYVDTFTGRYQKTINKVPVDLTKTIIDQSFNLQVGWPLGAPDALAAVAWSAMYVEIMHHGKVMTEALAKFAFKVTTQSQKGAANVGAKLAGSRGAGQTAAIGQGNDLVSLASAGRSYDFGGARPLASMVAASMNVSVVSLLADPGAAGSSYGSAQTLTPSEVRSGVMRQKLWSRFLGRVIKWATGEDVAVTFPPIEDSDKYREAQVDTLYWNSGTLHVEEMRAAALARTGIEPLFEKAPDGVLVPNTKGTEEITSAPSTSSATAPSPDQGKSNGTGGNQDKASDTRTDVLANMMISTAQDRMEEMLRDFEERLTQKLK